MARAAAASGAKASSSVPAAPRGRSGGGFKRAASVPPSGQPKELTAEKQRAKALRAAELMLQGKSRAEIQAALKQIDDYFDALKTQADRAPPMGGDGADEEAELEPQKPQLEKIVLLRPRPAKPGLKQDFWDTSRRGLHVPPLAPERPRKQQDRSFKRAASQQQNRASMGPGLASLGPAGAKGHGSMSGGARGGASPAGPGGGPR